MRCIAGLDYRQVAVNGLAQSLVKCSESTQLPIETHFIIVTVENNNDVCLFGCALMFYDMYECIIMCSHTLTCWNELKVAVAL